MRNDFCSNYLEHSAKGTTWKNAKYVARVKLSFGKYFYFYDQQKYQNYLKKSSGGAANRAKAEAELLKEPAKRIVSKSTTSSGSLTGYSSKTTEEKKAVTSNLINNGKAVTPTITQKATSDKIEAGKTTAQELLERARGKSDSSSKKSGSGSSKSLSSKSSKSSGTSKSKSSSSKSSGTKEKTTKEKATSSKQTKEKSSKETTSKVTTKKDAKLKAEERAFTSDTLKKLYGVKDSDVNKHETTEKMLENLRSYKDGAFGYIVSGNTTYKWTKENGKIVFKDFKTDKEVSLPSALNNIEEFRTDKKNKK